MSASNPDAPDPDALTAWLADNATRLATLDPDADDDSDLEPVLDLIGDARVVAVGESMHRVHEFFELRHRLFRFLVRRAGFTALLMESGFPEGLAADAWLWKGGPGLRETLRTGVSYHFGKCHEMVDQFGWMREQVATGTPLRYYGIDLPDSGASALPGILSALSVIDDADPHYAEHVRTSLLSIFDYLPADRTGLAQAAPSIHAYLALPEAERFALTARIADLVARVRARRLDYAAVLGDVRRVDEAIRAAEVAQGADGFLAAMAAGPTRSWPGANLRDVAMADTVEWILDREPRVLIAAANGHIKKTPYLAPPVVTEPLTMLGQHLAARLGDDYVAIGTTFGGGSWWTHRPEPEDAPGHSRPFTAELGVPQPGSLDAALAAAGVGDVFVDLHAAMPEDAAAALAATTGTLNGPSLEPADVRASFDGVVFVERVSPWHTWIDARGIG